MSSIYQRALGSEFGRLHPQIQRRFSLDTEHAAAAIGRGTLRQVWHGAAFTTPLLQFGSQRNVMFAESGEEIPFILSNYTYRDSFGRDTVAWIQEFEFKKPRRLDAYMIYSEARGKIIDYVGTHQQIAVDMEVGVALDGGLTLRSRDQRYYEGFLNIPLPRGVSGIATVREWYDEKDEHFHIEVAVENHLLGPVFGYVGRYRIEWLENCQIPDGLKPVREERRE